MKTREVIKAWFTILAGRVPSLSIEITKECPLRCPGCYAFDPGHLGKGPQLQDLSDFKGSQLVDRVLSLLEEQKPLHVSLVGGDPLVRHHELELLLPAIDRLGIHTQIVTSAFRMIPRSWAQFKKLNIALSVDGLAPEHDARRKPATNERILRNISGFKVNIHCTITSQIACRPGYLEAFLRFWSSRPEVVKIWFSMFKPQSGDYDPEILAPSQRAIVIDELMRLPKLFPILDMPRSALRESATPPRSPSACIFARTTKTVSADLVTQVSP